MLIFLDIGSSEKSMVCCQRKLLDREQPVLLSLEASPLSFGSHVRDAVKLGGGGIYRSCRMIEGFK